MIVPKFIEVHRFVEVSDVEHLGACQTFAEVHAGDGVVVGEGRVLIDHNHLLVISDPTRRQHPRLSSFEHINRHHAGTDDHDHGGAEDFYEQGFPALVEEEAFVEDGQEVLQEGAVSIMLTQTELLYLGPLWRMPS